MWINVPIFNGTFFIFSLMLTPLEEPRIQIMHDMLFFLFFSVTPPHLYWKKGVRAEGEVLCQSNFLQCWTPVRRRVVRMAYSQKCLNLTTRWERSNSTCVPCTLREGTYWWVIFSSDVIWRCLMLEVLTPGREVTPNCGFDDDGGQHELPTKPCKNGTYNDGRWAKCRPCSQCVDGYQVVSPCSMTTDAVCMEVRRVFFVLFCFCAGGETLAPASFVLGTVFAQKTGWNFNCIK